MERNILLLEDNKKHMAALEKILQELGRDICWYCAYTVKEAVEIAYEHRIHLFLIDIILDTTEPGDASGLTYAGKIREVSRYKHTPIIFITSLEDPQYFSYSQLHCFQYIEKPFAASQVRKTILEALEVPQADNEDRQVYFQRDGIAYAVYVKEIIYIESSRRRIRIHSRDKTREFTYKTQKEILKELDSASFIPSSRYSIINRKYIEYIDRSNRFVKLKHIQAPVEIGPIMKKTFMDRIKDD